jgi:mono/diheme cytochrome c family protein
LHLVFGISGLAMLATTIWMLAADHRREWKDYIRKFQTIETWTAEARLNQQNNEEYEGQVKQADEAWEATRRVVPDSGLLDQFEQAVRQDAEEHPQKKKPDFTAANSAYESLKNAESDARPLARGRFVEELIVFIGQARFREDILASEKKFLAADLDVARSQYELGVGNELPKSTLNDLQGKVNESMSAVDAANLAVQAAKTHRLRLESVVAQMTADETDAKKKLDDLVEKRTQLVKAHYERKNKWTNEFVSLPIFDAFGGTKVDQIWLPKLTIYNNFSDVARFDRCTNCHLAMDKTAPGSAVKPLYDQQHTVVLTMATPAEAPDGLQRKSDDLASGEEHYDRLLREVYGLRLADKGLFDPDEAMVSVVKSETAAAKAQLEVGDVIELVNDVRILDKPKIYAQLIESARWGQPLKLTVRRGLPNPFASHPRLDLFVGSQSPHKMAEVGCTICHDGQGSATAFKWASHTPNDPMQAGRWKRDHGWFDNHHWLFPQYPKRYSESLCLKCHHDVTELAASDRFPDPPAPKLTAGFHLFQQYGCYGCHEINGFDGPNRRIGPDLRTEPNYTGAAEALLAGGGLTDPQRDWASELARQPTNDTARHSLSESLKTAEKLPGQPGMTKRLVNLLDDVESPGKLRKVGPSLRHVKSKVDFDFLYSWIRQPSDFRPSTKMPQFFGQFAHLDGKGLAESKRFEPIEIQGIAEYLLAKSQPFEFAEHPKSVSAAASTERGKVAFQIRCLACHQHSDFPEGKMEQGPDLSRIGAKLDRKDNPDGPPWLYTWLRNPSQYHARTLMPNMFLDPLLGADGKLTDPAADVAAFLLGSRQDWEPKDVPARQLNDESLKALDDLALENLKAAFTRTQSEGYLRTGIPENRRGELKGDEVELVGDMTVEKKLRYVGRRSISKYGCAGCHDVPGFEDAKPIGTGLADWARKTSDKLAFEQIVEYMKHGHGAPGALKPEVNVHRDVTDTEIEEADQGQYGHTHLEIENLDPDTGFYMEKLIEHQREGFIWQKLREPRSYDYQKTQNKSYNERLRMPKFTVLDDQKNDAAEKREAIITFVLGMVSEPPASQYVYRAPPRRNAITQGLQVIEKFNCTGCHTLGMERWQLGYEPGDFSDPATIGDYAFLKAHFTPQQVDVSLKTDARGFRHATVTGQPATDEEGRPLRLDEDGAPVDPDEAGAKVFYSFVLWENGLINGQARPAGLQNLMIPESRIEKRYPPLGGFLARTAYPVVVAEEKKINPNVKADEAWGWLPPPLVGEGRKVQTAWLHDFLLDPHAIRPNVLLRMPKFNMSPADATKLVNYFAAVDGVDYPYDFDPRTRASHLESQEAEHPNRLNDAMKIVTDNNFCTKCHLLGDFSPTGSERAKAPHLDRIYKRLRPGFTMDWIANPKRLLPYTSMPVNLPYDKPVSQLLYKGTSDQQLNAVVDLLLNYDRFMEAKTSITPMITPESPEAPDKQAADGKKQDVAQ